MSDADRADQMAPKLVGTPEGAHQQLAFLFVWAALYRAYDDIQSLTATNGFTDDDREEFEFVLRARGLSGPPQEVSAALREVAVWREHSEQARAAASALVEHYRREYGLRIDIDTGVIAVDRNIDGFGEQQWRTGALEFKRERLALAAARHCLNAEVAGQDLSAAQQALRVPRSPRERNQIRSALSALGVSDSDSTTALFVIDYLCGRTESLDLYGDTPVLVDPGEEHEAAHHAAVQDAIAYLEANAAYTRLGRNGVRQVDVDGLIAATFDHRDSRAGADAGQGDPDLHTHVVVANRFHRAAVLDGATGSEPIWPNYISRRELRARLRGYRGHVREAHRTAQRLIDSSKSMKPELWDLREDICGLVDRLRSSRAEIDDQLERGHGLLRIEQIHIDNILDKIDLGEVAALPELLFVGELHKRDCDSDRRISEPSAVATGLGHRMVGALYDAGVTEYQYDTGYEPRSPHSQAVRDIEDYVLVLAAGEIDLHDRRLHYTDALALLDSSLDDAGASATARAQFRVMVEESVQSAAVHGAGEQERGAAWRSRISQTTAARDRGEFTFTDPHASFPRRQKNVIAAEPDTGRGHDIIAALPPGVDRTLTTDHAGGGPDRSPNADRGISAGP
ncbi:relaxase domain-containing protein [Nocardia sp. CA-119907]|uniref:relaxase domain-containing protein n=1 Tax=Nocardia sp. CA-119907 TaxID=3239973 RepID=UPI003D999047